MLSGSEPDIFIIPQDDLEKYIELGVLQDLSTLAAPNAKNGTENDKENDEKNNIYAVSLTIPATQEKPLMGISARAKYPKLTFELLQDFAQHTP